MNPKSFEAAGKLIPPSYTRLAEEARTTMEKMIQELLEKRKWPDKGWSDQMIELFLRDLSLMDSNNFMGSAGVGEREGRVLSEMVLRRHWGFTHGIGRSGDLVEPQPKAAGSSIINMLTNALALDAIKTCGINSISACFVVPVATGMAISLALLTLRAKRPRAKYVLWSRIDQKSCIKAVQLSGFSLKVIDTLLVGDELRTNLEDLERTIEEIDVEEISCVITTTSCFAPRAFDSIIEVAQVCKKYNIPHLVNNAYGLQSSKCCHLIEMASKFGRVDAFVQSTDKNFLVPVGGAVIAGFDKGFIESISKMYPGRASSSPSLDLLITLLSSGKDRFKSLLKQRKENFEKLKSAITLVAEKYGESVLHTPGNHISIAVSLGRAKNARCDRSITEIGSWLFQKRISGCRVVDPLSASEVAGTPFVSWGSHHSNYPTPYLTVAAAVGMEESEISAFLKKFDSVMSDWYKKSKVPDGETRVQNEKSAGLGE